MKESSQEIAVQNANAAHLTQATQTTKKKKKAEKLQGEKKQTYKQAHVQKKQNMGYGGLVFRRILFVLILFLLFFAIFISVSLIMLYISVPIPQNRMPTLIIIFSLLFLSFLAGIVLSSLSAKKISKPISQLEKATEEISKGNFDIQVEEVKNWQLNGFIKNFNTMARELKNNETLKSDFISNVSHEFKTPLAVISAYSKALRRDDLDPQTRQHYQQILDCNIKKLTNLTSMILNLSKIENQEIVVDKTEFLLDEQIREIILDLEPEWQKKNIELSLNLPTCKVFGSGDLLAQVWQNLLSNAIKFSNDGGKIDISLQVQDAETEEDAKGVGEKKYAVVKISDNGIGMSEETMKHVFDKFYQADKSHSGDGNGLGLSLVWRIVKIWEGEVTVESQLKKGSTFTVKLPILSKN